MKGASAILAVVVLGALLGYGPGAAAAPGDPQSGRPGTLNILVRDADTGQPIPDATVSFAGNVVPTDARGKTSISFRSEPDPRLEVDVPGYIVARLNLDGEKRNEYVDGGRVLTIDLERFETLKLRVRLRDKATGRPLHNLEQAELRLLGKTYDISKGRLELDLDYLKALGRATVAGQSGLEIEAKGYETLEGRFPLRDFAEQQRLYDRRLELALGLTKRTEDDAIQLNFLLEDGHGDPIVGASASVSVDGFGHRTTGTSTGKAGFRLERGELVRFRDRFQDHLDVQARANGFQGTATRDVPIADLLAAMGRGETSVDVTLQMQRASASDLYLGVSASSNQVRPGESVTIRYRVENNGNTPLRNVSVVDPACAPLRLLSSDAAGNGKLDIGESWEFECRLDLQQDLASRVRAEGTAPDGTFTRAFAPVSVTVNGCPAPQVEFPDVTGHERAAAEGILRRAGFGRVTVTSLETENVEAGHVLNQSPASGQCLDPQAPVVIATAKHPQVTPGRQSGPLRAELECAAGLEVTAGARPSRTCGVVVRGWTYNDEHVRLAVSHPGGTSLDVWPMKDSAWPPNMANPGIAEVELKQRYIFTLFFSAPESATPTLVPVNITVSQGASRVDLELDVSVLPEGRMPSQGSGIRPPATVATGSGEYCVWRTKSFGDPPPCFKFNIAACGTAPYATDPKYELVGSDMTKLQASARMSEFSRYGGDAYGCLAWEPEEEDTDSGAGHPGSLRAELECEAGLEITAGARPSRTCGVIVRGWTYNDEHVRLAVSHPGGTSLDVWPMKDSAWPPNMANPGVAEVELKQRYVFTLNFSAPSTATTGLVLVDITVTQGQSRVELDLPVNILPAGQTPSHGSGIRPPATVPTGSGEYCVWRTKSFGDPPPCFKFNIATCDTAPYATDPKYGLVGSNMTKLQASARMSELSRYGGDAYGCLSWQPHEPEPMQTCPDGSVVPAGESCPSGDPGGEKKTCPDGSVIPVRESCPSGDMDEEKKTCPDGSVVPARESCPSGDTDEQKKTCPNGSVVPAQESCPSGDTGEEMKTCPDGTRVEAQADCPGGSTSGDGEGPPDPGDLDCSAYGPHAELYWDEAAEAHLCRCQTGYDYHASDRCVPTQELGQCLEYPGTYPSGEFCECAQPDHYWSAQAGRCAPEGDIPVTELVDCSAYPGSLPERDPETGEEYCTCPIGTQWSDSLNRCATGSEERVATLDCSHKPGTVPEMDYYLNQPVCSCPGTGETWSESDGKCMDTNVAQNPGNQPNPPAPTTIQQGQCDDTARSGSDDAVRVQVEIAGASSVSLTYDTVNKEDRVRAFVDGTLVHDSGCVGTGGDVTTPIQVPANARLMEVDVYPNCTGGTGTRWDFVVACDLAGN